MADQIYEDAIEVLLEEAERQKEELRLRIDNLDTSDWEELLPPDQGMVSQEAQIENLKKNLSDSMDATSALKGVAEAFTLITEEMPHSLSIDDQKTVQEGLEHAKEVILEKGYLTGDIEDVTERSLSDIFELPPPFFEALQKLGDALFRKERVEDAKTLYAFLALMCPDDPNHFLGLGHCWTVLENHEKAMFAYYSGWERSPWVLPLLLYLGISSIKVGTNDLGANCFEMAKKAVDSNEYEATQDEKELLQILEEMLKTQ